MHLLNIADGIYSLSMFKMEVCCSNYWHTSIIFLAESTLKSKACFRCLFITKIISG